MTAGRHTVRAKQRKQFVEATGSPSADARQLSQDDVKPSVLGEAHSIVNGDRQKSYGPPENSFERIADFWNRFLEQKKDSEPLSCRDVCMMMILLKIARDMHRPKRDNLVDIAGYAELAERVTR